MDDWITTQQIISTVRERGCSVSNGQLRRWRAAKLLPAGVSRSRGRGAGAERRFPPDTVDRVLSIRRLQQRRRPLHEVGLCLWYEGYGYPETTLRTWLGVVANNVRHIRARFSALGSSAVAERFIDGVLRTSSARRRYKVAERDAESIERLSSAVENLATSAADPNHPISAQAMDVFLSSFGLAPAQPLFDRVGSNLSGEMDAALRTLSLLEQVAISATATDLSLARRMARALSRFIALLQATDASALPAPAQLLRNLQNVVRYDEPFGLLLTVAAIQRAMSELGEGSETQIETVIGQFEGIVQAVT